MSQGIFFGNVINFIGKGTIQNNFGRFSFDESHLAYPTLKSDLVSVLPVHCTQYQCPIDVGKEVTFSLDEQGRVTWVMLKEAYKKVEEARVTLLTNQSPWCEIKFLELPNSNGGKSYFPWHKDYEGLMTFGMKLCPFYQCILYKKGDKVFMTEQAINSITQSGPNNEVIDLNENLGRVFGEVIPSKAPDGFYYRDRDKSSWESGYVCFLHTRLVLRIQTQTIDLFI